VPAARERAGHMTDVRRRCEALWKQARDRAERNYNKKELRLSSR
jgi:hypothetical protein